MRKDAQENRQEILRVVRFLIAQQGPDVSLRTIASTAGVGIATLYRNFPTREDLLLGIVQETAEEAEAAIAECLETWDAGPEQAWRNYAHAVARQKIATFAMRMVETPGIEEIVEQIKATRAHVLGQAEAVLDRAKSAGFVGPDMTVLQFQIGLAIVTRPLPDTPFFDLPEEREWLIDVYLRGVRAE